VNHRVLLGSLLAFWLAFGPAASALAQSADKPCESTGMSAPADDDCCGDMDAAKCLSVCLAGSAAMTARVFSMEAPVQVETAVAPLSIRHASILAPPDIAPPKFSVS